LDFSGSGGQRWGGVQTTQYHPKCAALPAGVLDSEWAMSKMAGGDYTTRKYTYVSPKSSASPGKEPGKYDTLQSVDSVTSDQSKKVRDAIDKICDICGDQATTEAAKAQLRSKCEAIQKLRPEGEFEPFAIAQKQRPGQALEEQEQTHFIGIPTLALMGLLLGSVVAIAVRQLRGSDPVLSEEPLLSA